MNKFLRFFGYGEDNELENFKKMTEE